MQPRRLRLGDVVDDYCSRCRLLSNHAIAAIVDDAIKQTRCSTCDFEHPYKDGKLPARRTKKDGTSALYQQVLDNVTDVYPKSHRVGRDRDPIRPALARPDSRPQPVGIPARHSSPAPSAARAPRQRLPRPRPPTMSAPLLARPLGVGRPEATRETIR